MTRSSSKVRYVPYVEKGLLAHGVLLVLLGLAYCVAAPVSMMEGEADGLIALLGCLAPTTLLVGALQLLAASWVRKRRGRRFAIVVALLGSYGSCIALCLPASLLLGVFVTVVLLDADVRATFVAPAGLRPTGS